MAGEPDSPFVFAGDSGYGTHAAARFCRRDGVRRAPVSKCRPDANPFAPPPAYRGDGRPRVKGDRVPRPRHAAAAAARAELSVSWYGGRPRRVEAATGTEHRYRGGNGLAPIRRVFAKAATETHRDEYLFTTDPGRTADAVVGTYCGRGSIEATFREARSCSGLETTRGRPRRAVTRAAPCLFGLYSVVAVLYHRLPEAKRSGAVWWPGKKVVRFSDALAAVRRSVRAEGVFRRAGADGATAELPADVRELLLAGLAPAP